MQDSRRRRTSVGIGIAVVLVILVVAGSFIIFGVRRHRHGDRDDDRDDDDDDRSGHHHGNRGECVRREPRHCKKTQYANATPVIVLEDYANFDCFIATGILQKDPSIDLRLLVASYGFGDVGPSINSVYAWLAFLRNKHTPVVPGAYFSRLEVNAGPNPTFGFSGSDGGCAVGSCDGTPNTPAANDACLADAGSPRGGQVAQPIANMFIPPLWKENGATLYGTVNMLPQSIDPDRQYKSTSCSNQPFVPGHVHLADMLGTLRSEHKKAVILNTGAQGDLALFYETYGNAYDDVIEKVIIMGGGFFNFHNTNDTCNDPCGGVLCQRWAGNIAFDRAFSKSSSDPIPSGYSFSPADWAAKVPFTNMAEFNIFTDPQAAKIVATYLHTAPYPTIWVPTDATDPLLIGTLLDELATSPTPEGRFVNALLKGIRDYEDGGFDFVIRLWDIIAAETLLEPGIITATLPGRVDVHALTNADINPLKNVRCADPTKNPFDIFTYDAYYGQTTLDTCDIGNITVVTKIDHDLAIAKLIERLNEPLNSACQPLNYELPAAA